MSKSMRPCPLRAMDGQLAPSMWGHTVPLSPSEGHLALVAFSFGRGKPHGALRDRPSGLRCKAIGLVAPDGTGRCRKSTCHRLLVFSSDSPNATSHRSP